MPLQLLITGATPAELKSNLFGMAVLLGAEAVKPEPVIQSTMTGLINTTDPERKVEVLPAEQPAKRRGRQPRQAPAAEPAPATAAVESASPGVEAPSPSTPAAPATPEKLPGNVDPDMPDFLKRPPTEPTKDNAKAWLETVSKTKNYDAARSVLKSIGHDRMGTLADADYPKLIEACQKELAA